MAEKKTTNEVTEAEAKKAAEVAKAEEAKKAAEVEAEIEARIEAEVEARLKAKLKEAEKKATEEAKEKQAEETKPVNPMDIEERLFIPRGRKGEENFILITLNGKRYQIMKGVEVNVPRPVAEIYREQLRLTDIADDYIEAKADKEADE